MPDYGSWVYAATRLQAAMLGARVLKDFIVQKIESIIDEEKSVKHSKLSEQAEQVILDPSKVRLTRMRLWHCLA